MATPQGDPFKQSLAASRWEDVAQIIRDGVSVQEVQAAVRHACAESQWGFVTEVAERGCDAQQREAIAGELLNVGPGDHRYWQCLLQVVRLGVGCEVRNAAALKAAEDSQWPCVCEMTRMGVDVETRHRIAALAIGQGQLECSVLLIRLGVDREVKVSALRNAIQAGQVDFMLELVKACAVPDLTNLVVKQAADQSQWRLVSGLVTLNLSSDQMERVCEAAVTCGQWGCVLPLLAGGAGKSLCFHDEVFSADVVLKVMDLLEAEANPQQNLKSLILRLAVKHGQHEAYVKVVEKYQATDAEQIEALRAVLDKKEEKFFCRIITDTKSGRRVFKQLTLKKKWLKEEAIWMCDALKSLKEADLVLLLSAAFNFYWHFFTMFQESRDSKKLSRPIMQYLMSEDALGVIDFTDSYISSKADRRKAFLCALRKGDFSVALQMTDENEEFSRSDLKFAFRMYHALKESEESLFGYIECTSDKTQREMAKFGLRLYLQDALKNFSPLAFQRFANVYSDLNDVNVYADPGLLDFFKFTIDLCLNSDATGRADCFAEICCKLAKDPADLSSAVVTALKAEEQDLVHTVCKAISNQGKAQRLGLSDALVKAACQDSTSTGIITKELFDWECYEAVCTDVILGVLRKSLLAKETWSACMPVVEKWITEFLLFEGLTDGFHLHMDKVKKLTGEERQSVPELVSWCQENSCDNVALVTAVMKQEVDFVTTVLQLTKEPSRLSRHLLACICSVAINGNHTAGWDPLIAFFRAVEQSQFSVSFEDIPEGILKRESISQLVARCQKEELHKWEIYWRCQLGQWGIIDGLLESCTDRKIIDNIVFKAGLERRWNLMGKLLDKCTPFSESDEPLLSTMVLAVIHGNVSFAKEVFPRVDAAFDGYHHTDDAGRSVVYSILLLAIMDNGPQKSEELVRMLIKAGVSTFQPEYDVEVGRLFESAFYQALDTGKLAVAKLILASGAVSNTTVHQVKKDAALRKKLKSHGWNEANRFLGSIGQSPHSLKDLSRFCVSQYIDSRPGREERIKSLSVPQPVKDLIGFKDLMK